MLLLGNCATGERNFPCFDNTAHMAHLTSLAELKTLVSKEELKSACRNAHGVIQLHGAQGPFEGRTCAGPRRRCLRSKTDAVNHLSSLIEHGTAHRT